MWTGERHLAIPNSGHIAIPNSIPGVVGRDMNVHPPLSHARHPFDFPRSWMLPLLRESITHTELGYFPEAILPLANQLGQKGNASVSH